MYTTSARGIARMGTYNSAREDLQFPARRLLDAANRVPIRGGGRLAREHCRCGGVAHG